MQGSRAGWAAKATWDKDTTQGAFSKAINGKKTSKQRIERDLTMPRHNQHKGARHRLRGNIEDRYGGFREEEEREMEEENCAGPRTPFRLAMW